MDYKKKKNELSYTLNFFLLSHMSCNIKYIALSITKFME